MVNNPDYREAFEKVLEKRYQKHIEVEFHLKENRRPALRTVDVDRQLSALGIDFEEEEDDEDL